MSHLTRPPETDLFVPLPNGQHWDPHTIHTHYFGFSIPSAQIGAFLYLRYQPAFPLCQGGVAIFQGTDNLSSLDIGHLDYEITMPWPEVEANTITTANGLRIEFVEPGREARVSYASADGQTKLELTQTAVTPLFARGHVMPGEEDFHNDPMRFPGGSEQFMHCVGELVLHGVRHDVDCFTPRDRSWLQVRKETQGGGDRPPVGWTPMYFGADLAFNQVGFEAPDTDPGWSGVYEVPDGTPTHHFAWLHSDGETKQITRVRRNVLERQQHTFASLRQEIEAEDEDGRIYRFTGEAIATAPLPAWPNVSLHDSVYRWEDEHGRATYSTYQEVWFDRYQRAMKARAKNVQD
ncbi:hypothetical protein ABZ807_25730 [Micromonospora sp. NPDC047548]|uniref:DUF7064 domain-containing protein n=1 Tax=Micromonospora sp. NPDC047548 TaxID=3155624 RepID=UPI0033DA322A